MANIWLNYVSNQMIHDAQGAKGPFKNISFDCAASDNGIASVSVKPGQVKASTRKDGTVVENFSNVLIGAEGTKRMVSVKKGDAYERIEMTVEQIAEAFATGREAYRASQAVQATDAAVEPEVEETVEATKTAKKGGRKATKAKSTK